MTNSLKNIPAAACQQCGGWTSSGGMSQYAGSDVPVLGRTGCNCHRPKYNRPKLPTPAESLARPEGLSAKGKRAHKAAMAFLNRFAPIDPGGCQTFYTPTAWASRDPNGYTKGSVLVIIYDGGDVWEHLSYHGDFNSAEKFAEHMKKAGFRFEATNNYSGAIWAD